MGADVYAVAELKNDVMCSGFTNGFVRSDNEPSVLGTEGIHNDSVENCRCDHQDRRECFVRLAKQRGWPRAL